MPAIEIHFVGALRLFAGINSVCIAADYMKDIKKYVETNIEKDVKNNLLFRGRQHKIVSIWDICSILLNGKEFSCANEIALKDGDRIDLIFNVAGG